MRAGEENQIDLLLQNAFGSDAEARLVRSLRKTRVIAGETVLPMDGQIVGYYALSYMIKPKGWLCLAPVAVHSDMQRQGHGKRMVGILTEWARLTKTTVVVLGHPAFYTAAGFSHSHAAHLTSPYPIKNTLLAGTRKPAHAQSLVYPKAFDRV
jgi:putative acetyltransferase